MKNGEAQIRLMDKSLPIWRFFLSLLLKIETTSETNLRKSVKTDKILLSWCKPPKCEAAPSLETSIHDSAAVARRTCGATERNNAHNQQSWLSTFHALVA